MLIVGDGDALAGGIQQIAGNRFLAHRECKQLRSGTRNIDHRQFTFPGFAGPAFLRNLLDIPDPLAIGIADIQANPSPGREAEYRQAKQDEKYNEYPAPGLVW